MDIKDLIGKRIVAVKSYPHYKAKEREPHLIMFDDRKTVLELSEQDYYAFHDCSLSARNLDVWQDSERWERFILFPDSTMSL
jgi:hypothetical protein